MSFSPGHNESLFITISYKNLTERELLFLVVAIHIGHCYMSMCVKPQAQLEGEGGWVCVCVCVCVCVRVCDSLHEVPYSWFCSRDAYFVN